MAEAAIDLQYISKEMLDDRLQRIDERYGWNKELMQSNFNGFQAAMERDFEAFKNQVNGKLDRPDKKIDNLEKKIDGVSAELKQTKTELQGQIKALDKKIDGVKTELTEKINSLDIKIDGVEAKLTEKINGVKSELSTKIDGVKESIEHSDRARNLWLAVLTLVVTVATIVIPYLK